MTYSLGIDLGTTYTAAAIARGGRAEVVTLGYRMTSIPTVVVLTEDGTFLVGDPAERRATSSPERLAREFKRRVGDPTPLLLGGTPVSVDRLLAEVLGFVHRSVSQTEGGPPAATVVTHPANWGPFKRDVLIQGLRLAGMGDARLLPEPVAAATWYARAERLAPGATVAVYDLGGGTFDTVVLEMGRDGTFAVRGDPEGIERLGGVDIDAAVMGHVLRVIGVDAKGINPADPATLVAMAQLRRDCVEAKEALSSETTVTIPVLLPSRRDQVLLQRQELEGLITPLLAPTTRALARAVASAGLRPDQPDAVLLVGGASRTPLVAREVGMALARPVAVDAHPKHPVALGAALVAETLAPPQDRTAAAAHFAPPIAPAGPHPVSASGPPGVPNGAQGTARAHPVGASGPPGVPNGVPAHGGDAVATGSLPPATALATPPAFAPPGSPSGGPPWGGAPGPAGPPVRTGSPNGSGPPVRPPGVAPWGPPVRPRTTIPRGRAIALWLAVLAILAGLVYLARQATQRDDDGGGRTTTSAPSSPGGTQATDAPPPAAGAHLEWTVDLSEETLGAPVTDGQRAYVEDSTGRLSAIDMASGTVAWATPIGTDGGNVTPILVGDAIIASATEPDVIQALDAATGAVRWTVTDQWFYDPPVVVGDTIVVSAGFEVRALAVADGAERWVASFDEDTLWTPLRLAGDVLVAGTSGGKLLGIDAASGDVRFTTQMPRGDATIWVTEVVGNMAIAVDEDGYVTGVSPESGEIAWKLDAGAAFAGPVTSFGPDAAVLLDSREVLVVDPATGTERRRLPNGSTAMLPLPTDPPLLVIGGVSSLQAIAPDGSEAWSAGAPFFGYQLAFAGGALIMTDGEGHVAGYRVAG
jgi:molecular chaperone DnaK